MEYILARYKKVDKLDYTLEIVTPLFLGGADPLKAELRPPSLKGVLRFWWRAAYGQQTIQNNNSGIEELKKREAEIFGTQDSKSKIGIAVSTLDKLEPTKKRLPKGIEYTVKNHRLGIIDYLSYGLSKNKEIKEYFQPVNSLILTLYLCGLNDDQKNELIKTLKILLRFGGLGARTRNGFGNLYCKELELSDTEIEELYKYELSNFTAFSKKSKVFLFPARNTWHEALSVVGLAYREARLSLENKHFYDRRGLIAAPIVQAQNTNIRQGRHAKPFFLHVNKVENGYQGQILFIPYKYGNDNEEIFKNYYQACQCIIESIKKQGGQEL